MKRMKLLAAAAAALLSASAVAGGIDDDLESFFGDLNYTTVTSPGVYQGQTAGYYTGGGIYSRTPVRNYQLFSVQRPRFRSGCGGIDLFSGGFSHINADQFVEMIRNIGSNALSLAYMLGLQIVSPQISSLTSWVQDQAEKWNMGSINSCEAAGAALGGVLGFGGATEKACIVRRVSSMGEDYNTAQRNCRNNPDIGTAVDETPYFVKGNIAWAAMMKNRLFADNLDLAQAIMNVTGTIVITTDGTSNPQPDFRRIPSIIDASRGNAFLTALLDGGSVDIYRCNDLTATADGCMDVSASRTSLDIAPSRALKPKIATLLQSMQDKILLDGAATNEEMGLLNATSLPVYKYLTVSAAYQATTIYSQVSQFADLIASDILFTYMLDVMKQTQQATGQLADTESGVVREYVDSINTVRSQLSERKRALSQEYDQALAFTTATREYERALIGRLSPDVLQSAMWSMGR